MMGDLSGKMEIEWNYYSDSNSSHDNQDSVLINKEKKVCAIADGVTSGVKGKEASQIAVHSIDLYTEPEKLNQLVEYAHKKVSKLAFYPYYSATTLVIGAIQKQSLYIASVGDSSAFLKRGNKIQLLTESDRLGVASLSYAIGTNIKEIHRNEIKLQENDILLFCTDGVTDNLNESELASLMDTLSSREVVTAALNKKIKEDDISAIFAYIKKL
jgi:serine/threonine protein phosphatase PrpC